MSLTGKRQAIADALATVEGVAGHPFRPNALAIGAAWPLLGQLDRDAGTAFVANWRVLVVLPADEVAASEWLDAHWPDVFEALERVGFIDQAAPVALPTSSGDMPAFEITLRAEE